jgi:hypothetical protein
MSDVASFVVLGCAWIWLTGYFKMVSSFDE